MSRTTLIAAALACIVAVPAAAQSVADQRRFDAAQARFDSEYRIFQREMDAYRAASARGGPAPRLPYDDRGGFDDRYRNAPDYTQPGWDDGWRDEAGYDPARYYRPGRDERILGVDDRVYSGNDGRYYCRRSDGTTGLIVGGAAGGVLGNVIDGGRSRTVGTLIGGALGALAGRSVEQRQSQIRCR